MTEQKTLENPPPSRIIDGVETNRDRLIWQAGYDAHAEMMKLVADELKHLAHEMDVALADVRNMKLELLKKVS